MSILLRLGTAKLFQTKLAEIGPTNIRKSFGPPICDCGGNTRIIFRHAHKMHLRMLRPRKTRKIITFHKRTGNLARPITSKIKKDHTVAVFDQGFGLTVVTGNANRLDKFVGLILAVARFHSLGRRDRPVADPRCHALISSRNTVPPVIPVHRIKTSHNRRDLPDTNFGHFFLNIGKIPSPARRRRISPVSKRMKINIFQPVPLGQFQQAIQMSQQRMHPDIRAKSYNVKLVSACFGDLDGFDQLLILKK